MAGRAAGNGALRHRGGGDVRGRVGYVRLAGGIPIHIGATAPAMGSCTFSGTRESICRVRVELVLGRLERNMVGAVSYADCVLRGADLVAQIRPHRGPLLNRQFGMA